MGDTLKVLAEAALPDRVPLAGRILVDLCENVHIHHRDWRQEFSTAEFFEHLALLKRYGEQLRRYLDANPEYREDLYPDTILKCGPDLLQASPAPNVSRYSPRRLRVELVRAHSMGEVHIHWRDHRLDLDREQLRTAAATFQAAVRALDDYEARHAYPPAPTLTMAEVEDLDSRPRPPVPGPGHFARLLDDRHG
jgi:hypothetical protein